MRIGNKLINNCRLGTTQVNKVMLGEELLWQNITFDDFDVDYQLIIAIAAIRGFTPPSFNQQVAQNAFMGRLKAAGIWNKLDMLLVFAHDGSGSFGTINWKSPSAAGATLINSPVFEPNIGFGTDGVSSSVNTPFSFTSGVNYTLNNASIGYYNPTFVENPQAPIGVTTVANATNIQITAPGAAVRLNSGSNLANAVTPIHPKDTIGMISAHRTSSTDVTFIAGNQSVLLSIASTALPFGNLAFLRRGITYSSPTQRVAMGFTGASLVAEMANFNAAALEYMGDL